MSTRTGGLAALRTHSAREVLCTLLQDPEGLTQKEIQESSGLAHGTVSELLASLYSRQMLSRTEAAIGDRGRPAQLWRVRAHTAYSVGVAITDNRATVLMVDLFGNQCGPQLSADLEGGLANPHDTARAVARLLIELLETRERCQRVAAVTVSLPRLVSDDRQRDIGVPTSMAESVRDLIMRYWQPQPRPLIYIENDAHVCTAAERWTTGDHGVANFVYLKWDEELSGALVLGDALWRGQAGGAGQLGHIKVRLDNNGLAVLGLKLGDYHWPVCPTCGQIDCLDVLVGGHRVCKRLGVGSLAAAVSLAADEPRSVAAQFFAAGARLIGRALGPTLGFLDVQSLVIGGQVGVLTDRLEEQIRRGITESLHDDRRLRITCAAVPDDAPALGGALAALERNAVDFLLERLAGNGSDKRTYPDPTGRYHGSTDSR